MYKCIRAFTVIELLIVIMILLILMSIISPMVTESLSSAKKLNCSYNLANIGIANSMYMNDNSNFFACNYEYTSGSWDLPYQLLSLYLEGLPTQFLCPSAVATTLASSYGPRAYGYLQEGRDRWNTRTTIFRTTYASLITIGYNYDSFNSGPRRIKNEKVSSWLYMADGVSRFFTPPRPGACYIRRGAMPYPLGLEGPNPIHMNTSNILFVDNHVKGATYDELWNMIYLPGSLRDLTMKGKY